MALATSNLSVNSIYAILSVANGREIFYIGETLKTIGEFGTLVSKNGLNPTFCPGADADARLQNLLTDRKLSYFKGYEHITKTFVYQDGSMIGNFVVTQVSGSGGELHTISFEVDHIAIGRTASTGGIATIRLLSSTNYTIPAGEQFGIVYDDLATTTGSVVDIVEKLEFSTPTFTITSPADTSVDVDLLGGSTNASDKLDKVEFALRSSNAAFNIKIREIYYQ